MGREAELGMLSGLWSACARAWVGRNPGGGSGHRQVTAGGRAAQGAVPRLRWEECRCLSYGTSITYLLWLDLLRSVVRMTVEDSPVAVRDALAGWCKATVRSNGRRLSLSGPAHVSAARSQDRPRSQTDGGGSRRAPSGQWGRCRTSAGERPLVLVCEDLHWADPSSLELLEHLLALTDRASLLFLCVFRPSGSMAAGS